MATYSSITGVFRAYTLCHTVRKLVSTQLRLVLLDFWELRVICANWDAYATIGYRGRGA